MQKTKLPVGTPTVHLPLPPELHALIKKEADSTYRTMVAVIREILIERYLTTTAADKKS